MSMTPAIRIAGLMKSYGELEVLGGVDLDVARGSICALLKRGQIEDPAFTAMYLDLVEAVDWDADDPRLPAVADRLVAMFEEDAEHRSEDQLADFTLEDELVALLDEVFVNAVPFARRLLRLLEERGWRGWTQLERIRPPS